MKDSAAEVGIDVHIKSYPNPRVELEHHYYNASNQKLLDLGLEPHPLGHELVNSVLKVVGKYQDRIIPAAITPKTKWNPGELEGGALAVAQST